MTGCKTVKVPFPRKADIHISRKARATILATLAYPGNASAVGTIFRALETFDRSPGRFVRGRRKQAENGADLRRLNRGRRNFSVEDARDVLTQALDIILLDRVPCGLLTEACWAHQPAKPAEHAPTHLANGMAALRAHLKRKPSISIDESDGAAQLQTHGWRINPSQHDTYRVNFLSELTNT